MNGEHVLVCFLHIADFHSFIVDILDIGGFLVEVIPLLKFSNGEIRNRLDTSVVGCLLGVDMVDFTILTKPFLAITRDVSRHLTAKRCLCSTGFTDDCIERATENTNIIILFNHFIAVAEYLHLVTITVVKRKETSRHTKANRRVIEETFLVIFSQ